MVLKQWNTMYNNEVKSKKCAGFDYQLVFKQIEAILNDLTDVTILVETKVMYLARFIDHCYTKSTSKNVEWITKFDDMCERNGIKLISRFTGNTTHLQTPDWKWHCGNEQMLEDEIPEYRLVVLGNAQVLVYERQF